MNRQKIQAQGDISKQRASKACNRCRVKKARCSGGYPCTKCKSSDAVCIFGYPKKSKRKTFPEHYVRTLEMQQFKLVSGLQTMYFMLRASNSWPGSQLSEYKGNPRVHDILDRLGLLGSVGDDDPNLEMTADGTEVDGCNTDEASHSGSPARSQRESEISSRSPSEQSSASPHRVPSMQQGTSSKSDMQHDIHTWQPSPMQSQLHPFRPTAQPLSADFVLRTPPKMRSSLGRTLSTAQAVEAASWGTIDYLAPWWQEASQTFQPQPPLNITVATTAPGLNPTTVTSESVMSAVDDPSSYLVDPGVYACDFDME